MKKISVVTATRAEFGLLKPIIKELMKNKEFDVRIVVTGAHLSPEFGLTYQEIEAAGFVIDQKIECLLSADSKAAITKTMGLAMMGFADYFASLEPDLLLVLGDRYETLAVCIAAMNQQIPIAHLYGGETTEGAIDEAIRHAITKLSYLHFTSTESYRNRVIQLGEHPDRVFCVGAVGIENVLNEALLSKEEFEKSLEWSLDKPYAVITFHPVTLEKNSAKEQMEQLLKACEAKKEMQYLFTKANADADGRVINQMIDEFAMHHDNVKAYTSLGVARYLSALKYCAFVMGNSSSGIVEAPSFFVPTINIGDRQKGRIQAQSIINCDAKKDSILQAMELAVSSSFVEKAKQVINPYGDGKTSEKIAEVIAEVFLEKSIQLKKKFYDLENEKNA